jgi:hypothetical protein
MIIQGNQKFINVPFESEEDLEKVVQDNAELLFGSDSIYLPKAMIRTADGAGTVPDGFVVDLVERQWFIVEAELAAHGVWDHIAPQITKQISAARQPASRLLLTELVVNRINADPAVRNKFTAIDVRDIDIRQFLADVFAKEPIVALPIDEIRPDLREWTQSLKTEVRLWPIRKLTEQGGPGTIYEIPDQGGLGTEDEDEDGAERKQQRRYGVTIADLIKGNFLTAGQSVFMTYRQRRYEATIHSAGLDVLGEKDLSPSYAAVICMQNAGSSNKQAAGWDAWKDSSGRSLADLRDQLLQQQNADNGGTVE